MTNPENFSPTNTPVDERATVLLKERDKSIAAGASDYITKPVDMDQLLSLMRVWLHQ